MLEKTADALSRAARETDIRCEVRPDYGPSSSPYAVLVPRLTDLLVVVSVASWNVALVAESQESPAWYAFVSDLWTLRFDLTTHDVIAY